MRAGGSGGEHNTQSHTPYEQHGPWNADPETIEELRILRWCSDNRRSAAEAGTGLYGSDARRPVPGAQREKGWPAFWCCAATKTRNASLDDRQQDTAPAALHSN